MVPPEVEVAKVVDVVPDGDYTIDEVLVKIQRSNGDIQELLYMMDLVATRLSMAN